MKSLRLMFSILVFSCLCTIGLRAQNIPIEELGISPEEYNDILKNADILPNETKTSQLSLTLNRVGGLTNHPTMKPPQHILEIKNNPNRPSRSLIPYAVIREEGCDEDQ